MSTSITGKAFALLLSALRFGQNIFAETRCFACGVPVSKSEHPTAKTSLLCSHCLKNIGLLSKGYCRSCGLPFTPGSSASGPCSQCLKGMPPWEACYALGSYAGLLQQMILSLKFGGNLHIAHVLGELLAMQIASLAENSETSTFSVIVPVPLHPARLKTRGWNQSLEIARVLGRRLNTPVATNLLLRQRNDPPQESLGREARIKAVKGTFASSSKVMGRSILLVDDVMTTCATMKECSKVLLNAGAAGVSVVVAGRTPLI